MSHPLNTLWYFFWKGLRYGTLMGVLTGTMMYPLVGTIIGLGLGFVGGALGGLMIGLLVLLYNAFFLRYDTEHTAYRRKLTFLTGIITSVLMYGGLHLWVAGMYILLLGPTTRDWDFSEVMSLVSGVMLFYGTPATIAAGMTSAYAAHEYADWHIGRIAKRKNEDIATEENRPVETGMSQWYVRQFYRQLRWGIPVYIAFGLFVLPFAIITAISPLRTALEVIGIGIGFTIYALMITPFIATLNILLIKWLNRVVFQEFLPDLKLKWYRGIITFLAGVITLVCTPIAALFFGVPLATLITGRVAWRYANEFYAEDGNIKAKHKAAQAEARLEEVIHEDDESLMFAADSILKNQAKR